MKPPAKHQIRKGSAALKTRISNISPVDPSPQLLNSLLGHYQKGQYDDAEKLAKFLTKNFPKHPFGWKVLGVLYGQSNRRSEAVSANQKAAKLSPQDAEVHNNLGNALKALGILDEAETSYKQALAIKPDYFLAFNNLGNTLRELGRLDESEINLRRAIALKPNFAEAYSSLGITLKELGRLDEAETSYRQAIAIKPNYARAHQNLGIILKAVKKYDEAILHFDKVKDPSAISLSLECLYMSKNYSDFDKRIKSMLGLDDNNIRVAAVSAFAAHQTKKEDFYRFCPNPLDFISIDNLDKNNSHLQNLINAVIKETEEYQLVWESRTTKFGYQGPNDIFEKPSKIISNLEGIIEKKIDAYYQKYRTESCIFIKSWPKKYKLVGWYNKLVKNGYQTAHIHPSGWLSGVIYLKTINQSGDDEGAIEFGLHGYELPVIDESYPRKVHRPESGDIVLFPSSLFHRTIPFTTDAERCVIAFDLKPIW